MPRVSVVIPLFNKEKYIERAIRSVLSQSFQNFELIIINDGSTDESEKIVAGIQDARLILINQANKGPGSARNKGLKLAKSEYVAFLDADDEWSPDFLKTTLSALDANPKAAMVITSCFRGAEKEDYTPYLKNIGVKNGIWSMNDKVDGKAFKLFIDSFNPSMVLCKKRIISKLGGFFQKEKCCFGEDTYLWFKVILNYPVIRILRPLVWWHTEASELNTSVSRIPPLKPFLTDPDPIYKICPIEYRSILDKALCYYALAGIKSTTLAKDWHHKRMLEHKFPLKRLIPKDYLVMQCYCFLKGANPLKINFLKLFLITKQIKRSMTAK